MTVNGTTMSLEIRDWQYTIGQTQYPGCAVTNDITFSQNLDAMKSNRDLLSGLTLSLTTTADNTVTLPASSYGYGYTPYNKNYLAAYAVFLIRLNNDDEPGWISGLNTSGNVMYNTFTWNGTGTVTAANMQNWIFMKTTASFIVKYGMQAEIVW